MHRKGIILVLVGTLLFGALLLQMTAAQAAPVQQTATEADEPQPLPQPVRIQIRQVVPFTISLVPLPVPLTVPLPVPLSTTEEVTGVAATSIITEVAVVVEAPVAAEDTVTDTGVAEAAGGAVEAAAGAATEAAEEVAAAAREAITASEVLTAEGALAPIGEILSGTQVITQVPALLEITLDLVVTEAVTLTVPASVTLALPEVQTVTLPVSVTLGIIPDSEVSIELAEPPTALATPEETPTPEATVEITETVAASPTVVATVEATATVAPDLAGLTLFDAAIIEGATANLRGGPGTNFDIVGQAPAGQAVQIVAVSADNQWYLLADGAWVATFLIAQQPAGVPVVTDAILAQVTGGGAATPTPAATQEVTPATTAAVTPTLAVTTPTTPTVTTDANLRSGPGTEFNVLGGTVTGQALNIVGRNADGTWFRLDNGGWVFGELVANAPALDTVPVLNNDGTPVEPVEPAAPAATPTPEAAATDTGGLAGLLPTPTPQPTPQLEADANADYLAAAGNLVTQYDNVRNSVDALIAEAARDTAKLNDPDWRTRMNAAAALLRRTGATVGELEAPTGLATVLNPLVEAALAFNQAADALAQAAASGAQVDLDAAETAIEAGNSNLTDAENAIQQAQAQ
jgi:uncharacterized protein YgiM (DUF1202 family)